MIRSKDNKVKVLPAAKALQPHRDVRNTRIRFPGRTGRVGRPTKRYDLLGTF